MLKRYTKVFITFTCAMALGTASYGGVKNVSTAHKWAQPEIEMAYSYGLMPDALTGVNLSDRISRVQFAGLVVKLYETMTGEEVQIAPEDTFTDSKDTDILKANTLGIMKGANGKANPTQLVTRQEMAAMYYRTLDKVYAHSGKAIQQTDGILSLNDKALVANWCKNEVDYISEKNIMNGSNGNFNPLDNAGIEQAIVVVKRMYEDERNLKTVASEIDTSKGYTYKADKYGKNFVVTYTGNKLSNTVMANEFTSLKILLNDSINKKIYYKETFDDAVNSSGVSIYSYDVSKNQSTNLDDHFGHPILDLSLLESGKYKGHLLVSSADDMTKVYTPDLKFLCDLTGTVKIDNANSRIYKELHQPDDYNKGYTVDDDSMGNIYVTFNNNENEKLIVGAESGDIEDEKHIFNGSNAKVLDDYSKIFFMTTSNNRNRLYVYDFKRDQYQQVAKKSSKMKAYKLYEDRKLVIVKNTDATYDVYTYSGEYVTDEVYSFDDKIIKENLETYYEDGFKIVLDGKNMSKNSRNLGLSSSPGRGWEITENYAWIPKDKYGPMLFLTNSGSGLKRYSNNAVYECEMAIYTDESDNGNSGIVFNVDSIRKGNDQYRGYYVGIDLYNNLLIFGKANYNWQSLNEINIGDSIKAGDRIKLKVVKTGINIDVYVNDNLELSTTDSTYNSGGGFGLRSWNGDVQYYSLKASPNN